MKKGVVPVTVLMSVYNGEPYIREAVESILAQSFRDFEFLIIDDGSTDNSISSLKDYRDERLKIIQKPNTGLVDSLNVGLAAATGEWIARMDADDISAPDRLEKQLTYVKNRPELVLVGTNAVLINNVGELSWEVRFPEGHSALVNSIANGGSPFPHASAIFRRESAISLGGYNHRFPDGHDIDFWLRLSDIGQLGCIQEPLLSLRKHNESFTGCRELYTQFVSFWAARLLYRRRRLGLTDFAIAGNEEQWERFLDSVRKVVNSAGYPMVLEQRAALSSAAYNSGRRDLFWLLPYVGAHPQRLLGTLEKPLRWYLKRRLLATCV